MKLGIFLPVLCVGMIILTLVTLYQTKEPDSDRPGPFRRRMVVEENRGPISRLMSKIASYFKREEFISKNIPPGVIPDPLGSKNLDSSSPVDPYGLAGGR